MTTTEAARFRARAVPVIEYGPHPRDVGYLNRKHPEVEIDRYWAAVCSGPGDCGWTETTRTRAEARQAAAGHTH